MFSASERSPLSCRHGAATEMDERAIVAHIGGNAGDAHEFFSLARTRAGLKKIKMRISTGDITSARLFYERAVDAESGPTAVAAWNDVRSGLSQPRRPGRRRRSDAGIDLVSACA
jgi:hypothetical protein